MKKIVFNPSLIIYNLSLITCILFASCTKVVNINLNASNPNIVIDAEVTDQPGSYTVNLTQTVNFSDNNVFPAITGATVVISDNAGNTETLTDIGHGNYVTSHLQGVSGRTYHLSVTSNGKNYTATSTMPAPVALDSVVADTSTHRSGGGFGGNSNATPVTSVSVRAVFTDPAGITNYYRLIEYVNHIPNYNNITIISDEGQDGSVISKTVVRRDTTIHAGDTVNVILESIDANVYEYYRTLAQITKAQTGIQTATPGNPTTNLSNNALGFFSAYAVRSKYTIAP
ncbi:MAG TPA: DUF4249 domain-containing protein [Bacteroidia bacterium]|nr:DUF4249 domain-containing protein [Bacteroidia bacterium]